RMLGILRERAGTSSVFRAAVVHANALEDAQALAEDVRAQLGPEELYLAEVSPVIGTHTGPGTLGICIVTR
ncbi:MAG: DegV family protein, partial [Anaerolineae bacterium]